MQGVDVKKKLEKLNCTPRKYSSKSQPRQTYYALKFCKSFYNLGTFNFLNLQKPRWFSYPNMAFIFFFEEINKNLPNEKEVSHENTPEITEEEVNNHYKS